MYSFQKSKAAVIISLLGILAGAVVITSWLFNVPDIVTLFPGYDYTKFNTAVCFILLGSALLLTQFENKKYNKLLFLTLSFSLMLIAAISLSEYIFHFNAGIDQLFITDRLAIPNKYPFPAAYGSAGSGGFWAFGPCIARF